jgi:RNA polymerase sigma-70 factor, ECF subfamily
MDVADQDLLRQYGAGNPAALGILVERYRRPLFGYILNMTGGRVDADEIFQEVWMRVIRKVAGYRDQNFYGWLVRIAHNLVIDKARRRRPEVSLDAGDEDERASLGAVLADGSPGPDAGLANRDLRAAIGAAVEALPVEQREVFIMRVKLELPFKEIAAIQKTSINTALARMQYALGKLRALLRERYAELGAP